MIEAKEFSMSQLKAPKDINVPMQKNANEKEESKIGKWFRNLKESREKAKKEK